VEQEIIPNDRPITKPIERVTLGKEEAEKVATWLRQIEESSKGFLILSRSDVVNFLIRHYRPVLAVREIQQIRVHHYDPIRHLNWITPRLKDALERSDSKLVSSLQDEIRSIELSVVAKPIPVDDAQVGLPDPTKMQPKRRKRAPKSTEAPVNRDSIKETQSELPES